MSFANSDARMVAFFGAWLRRFFMIDESRLRMPVYLHEGLDVDAAAQFWSAVSGVPLEQFGTPHRPPADPSIRVAKHQYGCAYLFYNCSTTYRLVRGLVGALLSSAGDIPG